MKKNISIILSILALAIASVLAVLLACRNVTLSSISLDSFVGVMVAMIGILVTFAVGWQIINALEIKGKLAEIEKLKPRHLPAHQPDTRQLSRATPARSSA